MAHRTLRLTDEDERSIARIQDHFRQSTIPIEVHHEAPQMINGNNATLCINRNITADRQDVTLRSTRIESAQMAHRTLRLTDEDERNIARIQDHFRQSTIPIEVHWNEIVRTGLRELAQRLAAPSEGAPAPPVSNGATEARP